MGSEELSLAHTPHSIECHPERSGVAAQSKDLHFAGCQITTEPGAPSSARDAKSRETKVGSQDASQRTLHVKCSRPTRGNICPKPPDDPRACAITRPPPSHCSSSPASSTISTAPRSPSPTPPSAPRCTSTPPKWAGCSP